MSLESEILVLNPHDIGKLTELIRVFEIVFEMENYSRPGEVHLEKLLQKNNFLAIVALSGNQVIGGLTVYLLDQYHSQKPLAYIYDLAVLKEYQRKGIGKKLMRFTNEFCRQKGCEEVYVQADKVDTYAIDFYRKTKPTAEEEVVQFSYTFPNFSQNG